MKVIVCITTCAFAIAHFSSTSTFAGGESRMEVRQYSRNESPIECVLSLERSRDSGPSQFRGIIFSSKNRRDLRPYPNIWLSGERKFSESRLVVYYSIHRPSEGEILPVWIFAILGVNGGHESFSVRFSEAPIEFAFSEAGKPVSLRWKDSSSRLILNQMLKEEFKQRGMANPLEKRIQDSLFVQLLQRDSVDLNRPSRSLKFEAIKSILHFEKYALGMILD